MPGRDALCTFCASLSCPEEAVGVSVWTPDGTRTGRSDPSFATAESPDGNLIALMSPGDGNQSQNVISITDIDHFDGTIDSVPHNLDLEIAAAMADGNSMPTSPRSSAKPRITASLTQDGSVQIVDSSAGGEARRVCSRADRRVEACAISPDGTRLVTGDGAAVQFYDMGTCHEMATFEQKEAVKELKFTPDGTRLIVRFGGGSVQIWDSRPLAQRRRTWARRRRRATRSRVRQEVAIPTGRKERLLAGDSRRCKDLAVVQACCD